METQSSKRDEIKTIFVALTIAIFAMSGLVAAMVHRVNQSSEKTKRTTSQLEQAKSATQTPFVDTEIGNETITPPSPQQPRHLNASFAIPAPEADDTRTSSEQWLPLQTAHAPRRVTMTATELHNTLRDLFRISRQQYTSLPSSQQQTSREEQVLAVLNDPTLQSQSPLWRFLFEQKSSDHSTVSSIEATRRLSVFLPRAFRRPVAEIEVEQFVKHFDAHQESGHSFQDSMAAAIERALTSEDFLSLSAIKRVSTQHLQYLTASRLSYLLWETMPNDYLLLAAREGRLSDHKALRLEVRRMLKDEKSRGFARRFGMQWLNEETLTNAQLKLLHKTFSANESILGLVKATDESDALKTLAKADQLTAKWVLEVLLYRERSSLNDEASDRKLLKDWLDVDSDDFEQVRQMVLNNREIYTDSFVRHLISHANRLFDNLPTMEVKEISNTVMFNQYLAHNLVEEVIVNAALGSENLSSISRKLTAEERMRR